MIIALGALRNCTKSPAIPGPAIKITESLNESLLFASTSCSFGTRDGKTEIDAIWKKPSRYLLEKQQSTNEQMLHSQQPTRQAESCQEEAPVPHQSQSELDVAVCGRPKCQQADQRADSAANLPSPAAPFVSAWLPRQEQPLMATPRL